MRALGVVIIMALAGAAAPPQAMPGLGTSPASPGSRPIASAVTRLSAYAYGASGWTEFGPVKIVTEEYDVQGRLLAWSLSYSGKDIVEYGRRLYREDGYLETVCSSEGDLLRTIEVRRGVVGWSLVARDPDGGQLYAMEPLAVAAPGCLEYLISGMDGSAVFRSVEILDAEGRPEAILRFTLDGRLAYASGFRYRSADEVGNWTERDEWERYGESWERPRSKARRSLVYAEAGK